MRTLAIKLLVLASIHGSNSYQCTIQDAIYGDTTFDCSWGCCGGVFDRYCCTYPVTITSWSHTSLSTWAIVCIVVACVIVVAVVGSIARFVCCARRSPSNRGTVLTSSDMQMSVITHGTQNTAYAPSPQVAYPMSSCVNTTTQMKF